MSQQTPVNPTTTNPTTTVQVKEIGLPEQMSVGKVLTVAGVAAGAAAGLIAMLAEKEEKPATKVDSARDYLRSALEQAQSKDYTKDAKKRSKRAEKNLKKQSDKAMKEYDKLVGKAKKQGESARSEGAYLLDLVRNKSGEIEQKAEDFAEGTLMAKLREFAEEARVIAEEGKIRTAGFAQDVTHKTQDDLIPQAKHGVDVSKEKYDDALKKAKEDLLPQAREAAAHGVEVGKERYEEALKKAKDDLLPQAKEIGSEFADHAKEAASQVGHEATAKFADANEIVGTKAHDATEAVKRGSRETRSLLMWVALAGILVFTVFLDEEQQKKLKEVAVEVFGEARDMYTDMKGDTTV